MTGGAGWSAEVEARASTGQSVRTGAIAATARRWAGVRGTAQAGAREEGAGRAGKEKEREGKRFRPRVQSKLRKGLNFNSNSEI